MGKVRLTMAQTLLKFLDNQCLKVDGEELKFVEGIFAIFGHGNVLGLGQAQEPGCGGLRVFQGRNKQSMAHAAIGFAKQSLRHQIIACTSSIGPGAANMITATATATANRIPLLPLPGDIFATRQPAPVLQQIEQSHDISIRTNDAFRPVSKYRDRMTRPEQLMSACLNAMRVLTDPAETGAVTLCLPQDVQGEAWDYPASFFVRRVHQLDRRLPSAAQLESAIDAIKTSRKPLMVCGGGVKYAGAGDALTHFASRYGIPFAETQAGKGTIISSHPLNAGGIGETGCLAANMLAKEADLVIGIGTRFSDFTTSSKWIFQHPSVRFLNINVSSFDAWKLDGILLLADARKALDALNAALEKDSWQAKRGDRVADLLSSQLKETQRVYQAVWRETSFMPAIGDHLDRASVYREFGQLTASTLAQSSVPGVPKDTLPEEAVIVAAAGSLPDDRQRVWRKRFENTCHVEYGYACMGYEVNAALRVKLAQPQSEIHALVDDGSFMMPHSELVTSLTGGRENQYCAA